MVQWFKVILAHQSVKVKRKTPWRGPFFEKRYKKTSGDCRQRTGRAPWYHLFLPPPRECGLNGYPAIPSLCNGRTRFRSTCPRRERSSDGSGEEISSYGTRPLAPTGNSLTGSLRALRCLRLRLCWFALYTSLPICQAGFSVSPGRGPLLRSKDAASERSRQQEAFGKERTFPLDIREKIRYDTLGSKTKKVGRHRRILGKTRGKFPLPPCWGAITSSTAAGRPWWRSTRSSRKSTGHVEGI